MVRKTKIANNQQQEIVVKQEKIEHYSGIIPHHSLVEGYEKVCPGAADRILSMTENDLKHRQELERKEQENIIESRNKVLDSEIANFKRGQYFGFIIMIIALLGGFYLVINEQKIGGYTTLVSTVFLYFGAVIYKNKIEKNANNEG